MKTRYDVAIIGAGIAGTFLAYLLGKRGLQVIVLEKGPAIGTKGAEFLKPGGIEMFERYGLLDSLFERGALRRQVIRYYHNGQLMQHFDFQQYQSYYLIAPYEEIVGTIFSACQDYQRIEFRFLTTVSSFEADTYGITKLQLTDGDTVEADVFVGADGARSVISSYINSEVRFWEYDHAMFSTQFPLTKSVQEFNRLYFSSDRWFAYFYPIDQKTARCFIGVPCTDPSEVQQQLPSIEALAHFVTESDDVLPYLQKTEYQYIPIVSSLASKYYHQNAILIGSGAFSVHPMTGLGMSYTLEDAEILAHIILDFVKNQASLDRLLEKNYTTRQRVHKQLIDYGNNLVKSYSDADQYLTCFQPEIHSGYRRFK